MQTEIESQVECKFNEDGIWNRLHEEKMQLFPKQSWQEHHSARAVACLPGWPWSANRPDSKWVASALAGFIFTASENPFGQAKKVADAIAPKDNAWFTLLQEAFKKESLDNFRSIYGSTGTAKPKYIIDRLLLERSPMILGGPAKSMKTSTSINMAAALTTGTKFLQFEIQKPVSVAALSLETRPGQWRDLFCRAVKARGHDPADAMTRLFLTDNLSVVRKKSARNELAAFIYNSESKVMILDPLYLIGLPVQAADLSAQGKMLRTLCRPILERGASPVLIHHFTKSTSMGDLPTLADLSGAGVGPFARSWLLLNRASEYDGHGVHNLLALAGNSTGDCSQMRVQVDERSWSIKAEVRKEVAYQIVKRPICLSPRVTK